MQQVHILHAGCVMEQVRNTVALYNASQSESEAVSHPGGSVECIRRMQRGEPCDLLILADDAIITSMMMPAYTDGYLVFAGNSMVLVPTAPDKQISTSTWKETLLAPSTTFGHFDPTADPGGYRAVFACQLADAVEPGLAERLLNHPGRKIISSPREPGVDFMFGYRSGPVKRRMPFADLPVEMNLSDPSRNAQYALAQVDLDGDGKNVVHGSAISHAVTLPFSANLPEPALHFADLFLRTDFVGEGFLPAHRVVGRWPPR